LGTIYVAGLTTEECARDIERRIIERNLIQKPEVTVKFLNARVTIIGAVKTPHVINLTSERNTVLDALAQSGDLDDTGLPKRIKLFRENNGERMMYDLDLTDVSIFESPAYYLQQNDLIYVEFNKSKNIKKSSFYTFLGAGSSILALVSSIVALVYTLKKD
jgi:polysaccharide export outer membrane protein